MSEEILSSEELVVAVKRCPEWDVENEMLVRGWEFETFEESMEFVNTVADVAEEAFHHPDILIRYNKVKLTLVTHEIGGITAADLEMAVRIDNAVDT